MKTHQETWAQADLKVRDKFSMLEKQVDMVAWHGQAALIVLGKGGIGKTHTVIKAAEARGYKSFPQPVKSFWQSFKDGWEGKPNGYAPYFLHKGEVSPKALYRMLYEWPAHLHIFDDADSVLRNKVAANILKAALDSYPQRVITWASEVKTNLPKSFQFTGRVIFISNQTLEDFPQPILSRCNYYEIKINKSEMDHLIWNLAQYFPKGVNRETAAEFNARKEVAQWLISNSYLFRDYNLRTFQKVWEMRQAFPTDWMKLAKASL